MVVGRLMGSGCVGAGVNRTLRAGSPPQWAGWNEHCGGVAPPRGRGETNTWGGVAPPMPNHTTTATTTGGYPPQVFVFFF